MKVKTILTVFVALCVAIAAMVWLGPVYRDNRRTRESLRRLQTNLEHQSLELDQLNRELTKLRTDSRAIERVAREKFGLCRENERIYHFEAAAAEPSLQTDDSPALGLEDPAAGGPPRP